MICSECGKSLDRRQFYHYKDGSPFFECKQCMRNKVHPDYESTYMCYLREFDVPYIKKEWAELVEKKRKHQAVQYVIGTYINKMYLKGFKGYSFQDSDYLNECYERRDD